MNLKTIVKLIAGPALGAITGFLIFNSTGNGLMAKMAGVVTWMATWWILEAVSLYLTSLLPLILFPLFGLMGMKEVAPLYTNHIIFLFVGGFMIAFAMERWNLHKRIALKIILMVGGTPTSLLIGFMLASYILSMWILNTSTVMMLLPALMAVIDQVNSSQGENTRSSKIGTALLLGLAYAASIGGTASLIGTVPNQFFSEFFNERFSELQVGFGNWFMFGFPLSLIMLVGTFFILKFMHFGKSQSVELNMSYCRDEYKKLGPMRYEEKIVLIVFLLTVLLWFFRAPIKIGSLEIPGWTSLSVFNRLYITDSTIAILMGTLMFFIPALRKEDATILRWQEMKKIPLGVIFLFGAGFALAKGVEDTGLSDWIAERLSGIQDSNIPAVVIVFMLCLFMTFFTELASNTASTVLILPIIYELTDYVDSHPLLLMLPVTISASFAFMLPVATPPNTIVFGSERLDIKSMIKTGLVINLLGAVLATLATFTLGKLVFGI